jgi:hypothetical protein
MLGVIDSVFIDTSAIIAEQSDFIGLFSGLLRRFYTLIQEQEIELLSHPIISTEIKNHIGQSVLVERVNRCKKSLEKHKEVLSLIEIPYNEILKRLDSLEIKEKLTEAFDMLYQEATTLSFSDPKKVFDLYFNSQPPFADQGDKKHEFPDAFVIESIKDYHSKNRNKSILIISNDKDWHNALKDNENILIAESVEQGMQILLNSENILPIFKSLKTEIAEKIEFHADCQCYELVNSDLYFEDCLDVNSVSVEEISDEITPLKISDEEVIFRTTCFLKIGATGTGIDEDRSYWDKEDSCYYYIKYYDISFKNGEAEVKCEISITFNNKCPEESAEIKNIKIIAPWNIEVTVDDDDVTYTEIFDEDPTFEKY